MLSAAARRAGCQRRDQRPEREAVQAARGAVLERARTADGEVLQSIIEEFDFEEGRLDRALGHRHQTS